MPHTFLPRQSIRSVRVAHLWRSWDPSAEIHQPHRHILVIDAKQPDAAAIDDTYIFKSPLITSQDNQTLRFKSVDRFLASVSRARRPVVIHQPQHFAFQPRCNIARHLMMRLTWSIRDNPIVVANRGPPFQVEHASILVVVGSTWVRRERPHPTPILLSPSSHAPAAAAASPAHGAQRACPQARALGHPPRPVLLQPRAPPRPGTVPPPPHPRRLAPAALGPRGGDLHPGRTFFFFFLFRFRWCWAKSTASKSSSGRASRRLTPLAYHPPSPNRDQILLLFDSNSNKLLRTPSGHIACLQQPNNNIFVCKGCAGRGGGFEEAEEEEEDPWRTCVCEPGEPTTPAERFRSGRAGAG